MKDEISLVSFVQTVQGRARQKEKRKKKDRDRNEGLKKLKKCRKMCSKNETG